MTIATHNPEDRKRDVWAKLAAPIPTDRILWRIDGKPSLRDGKWFARFVAYIDAPFVMERLDTVVPGEWDVLLTADGRVTGDEDAAGDYAVKARLSILGCIRESYGQGRDPKAADTDAFKRAAVRFGIGRELYDYEQNWVQVDGDGRFAKPLEDPQTAYNRRWAGKPGVVGVTRTVSADAARAANDAGQVRENGDRGVKPVDPDPYASEAEAANNAAPPAAPTFDTNAHDNPGCPKCGGRMWDNRVGKRNPKAPDFKCRDRSCDGVIWPPKANGGGRGRAKDRDMGADDNLDAAPPMTGTDDIPF